MFICSGKDTITTKPTTTTAAAAAKTTTTTTTTSSIKSGTNDASPKRQGMTQHVDGSVSAISLSSRQSPSLENVYVCSECDIHNSPLLFNVIYCACNICWFRDRVGFAACVITWDPDVGLLGSTIF